MAIKLEKLIFYNFAMNCSSFQSVSA